MRMYMAIYTETLHPLRVKFEGNFRKNLMSSLYGIHIRLHTILPTFLEKQLDSETHHFCWHIHPATEMFLCKVQISSIHSCPIKHKACHKSSPSATLVLKAHHASHRHPAWADQKLWETSPSLLRVEYSTLCTQNCTAHNRKQNKKSATITTARHSLISVCAK